MRVRNGSDNQFRQPWKRVTRSFASTSPSPVSGSAPHRLNFKDPSVLRGKSTNDLAFSWAILKLCANPLISETGPKLLEFAEKAKLAGPMYWAMEQTFYRHFVAGASLEESRATVDKLATMNIKTTLDYSIEAADKIDHFVDVLLKSMELTASRPKDMRFGVYKTTALVGTALLERMGQLIAWKESHPDFDLPWYSLGEVPENWAGFVGSLPVTSSPSGAPPQLNQREIEELKLLLARVEKISIQAEKLKVPVLIDAEQTWLQEAIHFLALAQKQRFNKESPIIFNTYQMYLKDTFDDLKRDMQVCDAKKLHFGGKLVRGAYMVGEAERAKALRLPLPLQPNKAATDLAYDKAVSECLDLVKQQRGAVVIASHNEETMIKGTEGLNSRNIPRDSPAVHFAQLYGMMDHATLALANEGYNVLKYVPFGPVHDVMPYLVRRMQENNGFLARTVDERNLIKTVLMQRFSSK